MKRGQLQPCEGLLMRFNLPASWKISRKEGTRRIFFLNFFVVEIFKHTQSKENDIKGMQHHLPITQFQQLSKVCHSSSATHTHTHNHFSHKSSTSATPTFHVTRMPSHRPTVFRRTLPPVHPPNIMGRRPRLDGGLQSVAAEQWP